MKTIRNIFCVLVLSSTMAMAEEIGVGKIYRLGMTIDNLNEVGGDDTDYAALKRSKFIVLEKGDDGNYTIQFTKIYKSKAERFADTKWVFQDKVYILPAKIKDEIDVSSISKLSLAGLSAGPLVVPFKYRIDDRSLAGDAVVGFYTGVTVEPGWCKFENWCFRITPLISAGISQVSVSTNGETENKSSATWAAGFLITDWAGMNIGFIYGQDRIGDNDWEHEGEGWLSFMIGWEL